MRSVNIYGKRVSVVNEPSDIWDWIEASHWELQTFGLLDKYVTPETTVLDLGAWIGPISLYAAQIAKRVIAVEPDPVAYTLLQVNALENGDCFRPQKIQTIRKAVTGKTDVVTLGSGWLGASTTRLNPEAGGGIGAWDAGQTFTVNSVSLDDLVYGTGCIGDPLFIKMDIEGAEEQVLWSPYLESHKPTLYVSLHPFWWREPIKVWDRLKQLSDIYGGCYDILNERPVNFETQRPSDILFHSAL